MLRDRLIVGFGLIALLLGLAWFDQWLDGVAAPEALRWLIGGRATFPPGTVLLIALAAISGLASVELTAILRDKGIESSRALTWASAFAGLAVSGLIPSAADGVTAVAVASSAAAAVLLAAMLYASRNERAEGVVAAAGGALLAFIYLGLMFGFVLLIRREHSVWWLVWALAVTKSSDIGAYFTGRAIGRRKLIPWLSPGKTWEGLFGGVVLASVVAVVGAWWIGSTGETPARLWVAAIGGAIFGVAGQIGDLIASMLKRDAGRKDSGKRLPGFGGVLDVIDSPLLVMPIAFWWLRMMLI
ncbi:MAG: phosphatidate cytidylyltransferase [Planctomycetota bacterium]